MNSGLISGPVQAAKNGRWRKWELTVDPIINGFDSTTAAIYSNPPAKSQIVPIPSYVKVARVSATSGAGYASGAACKNVLMSLTNGRKIHVYMYEGGSVFFGTLLSGKETANGAAIANLDVAVYLITSLYPGFIVYNRGVAAMNISGSGTPTLRPFLGGSLVTGFYNTTGPNPLDPQIRGDSGNNPSMLFGGQLSGVPGATNFSTLNPNTGQSSASYICVEWME